MRNLTKPMERQILAKESSMLIYGVVACCFISISLSAQKTKSVVKDRFERNSIAGKQKDGTYVVPTSQIIDAAGTTITFPGRPVDLALNPDETILAVKNLTDIVFFDVANQSIKQTLALPQGGNT